MATFWDILKKNWKSGFTVGVISFPLVISLAVATNATPIMGIITAVWAGGVASLIGGSHLNVTGPTGALAGILGAYALTHGPEVLPFLALSSGLLLVVAYFFRLSRTIIYIPHSVIQGFMLGVAILLLLNSLSTGLTGPNLSFYPLVFFFLGLWILFAAKTYTPRIPGIVFLVILGLGMGYLQKVYALPFSFETLGDRFGSIQGSLIQIPAWNKEIFDTEFVKISVTVALISLIETLLSGKVADHLTHSKFQQQKEVLGLACANLASGLFGGLPSTASLSRTALNIKQNATHKVSGALCAAVVATISLFFLKAFEVFPMIFVSAALVYTALRMIQREHFLHIYKTDRPDFFLAIFVALLCVAWDPLYGILAGSTWTLLTFLRRISHGEAEISLNWKGKPYERISHKELASRKDLGEVLVYRFYGLLTYLNIESHLQALQKVQGPRCIILGFRNVFYLDYDGLEGLNEMVENLEGKGIRVLLSSISPHLEKSLLHSNFYERKQKAGECFSQSSEAIRACL